jgi:hypothetical protein
MRQQVRGQQQAHETPTAVPHGITMAAARSSICQLALSLSVYLFSLLEVAHCLAQLKL